jgi:hypothetical protein
LGSTLRHPVATISVVFFFACFGMGPLSAIAAPGPRADIPATTHDFGEVFEDKALSHTFVINNPGDAPLRITNIDPDCACTAADYDRSIPPGGQGKLNLTIAPYSVLRNFKKETKVFFNAPERPMVVFRLKGYGQPIIDIQPSHVIRLRGKAGQDITGQVRLISHLPGAWEITGLTTTIPRLINVDFKAETPGKTYVLTVRYKGRKPGDFKGDIVLANTSPTRPRLILRVFGEIK